MSFGIRSWTETDQLDLDTNARAGRYLGAVDTNGVNGSLTASGFSQGDPIYKVLTFSSGLTNVTPIVSFSGNTMSWSYPAGGSPASARIVYGVR